MGQSSWYWPSGQAQLADPQGVRPDGLTYCGPLCVALRPFTARTASSKLQLVLWDIRWWIKQKRNLTIKYSQSNVRCVTDDFPCHINIGAIWQWPPPVLHLTVLMHLIIRNNEITFIWGKRLLSAVLAIRINDVQICILAWRALVAEGSCQSTTWLHND